ncbi:protein EXECUTER 1, chloroplastic-like [Lolium rigidum]|uniref:protein EXECUTER 1, chloroplastic-like n=1 Tax=Lolium rigidum TaxID=89674 RepID=UPI001F5DC41F|nr:protein EXECUTER 1, chloroplastic-like [Lolium rigidum]
MASVHTAPRAPLPATGPSSSSPPSHPNPSRFLAARRLRVRRLAGAAPTRRASDAASAFRCGARSPGADSGGERRRGWDALFHGAFQGAVRRWSEYVGSRWPSAPASKEAGPGKRAESSRQPEEKVEEDGEGREVGDEEGKWSWERWKQHFALIQESEGLVDELQLQLRTAVYREDYRSAHKLKLAIIATSRNDTVGRAISDLHRAISEERYMDAAHIRDHAGAGLLGWWSGISGSLSDPYGLIIRISAEHGRYVAKSYDIRQLGSDGHGFPIFEIYFAEANGGYNLQAVHLKPDASDSDQLPNMLSGKIDINSMNISSSSLGAKHEEHDEGINMDDQSSDDSDVAAGPAGLKNLSNDSPPVPRIKILKVAPMENINQDYIIKIFDQMSEEDDENDDAEIENESSQDIGDEDNNEEAEIISAEENNNESGEESDIEALLSIGIEIENGKEFASQSSPKTFERMPAKLDKRDRFSFSFYTEQSSKKPDAERAQQIPKKRVGFRTIEQDGDLKFDRVKLAGGNRKLPILQLGLKQHNNNVQPKLYGVTHFSRIQMPISSDPLSGLYETASGFDSEVLSLQRKFGQWQEDDSPEEHVDLKFYEYVEAVKLTGDNLVPAGQVVFRAKVGKHYLLPHKGIIPRELGVVARYKGQRRIADAGFQNPRWVDGELLILDGKFIRDGPVIAFFYWTSNLHLFEFFRRLSLPD